MKVLIVEEDRDNAKAMAGWLALSAKQVSVALTATEAVERLKGGWRPNCVLLNPHTANGIKLVKILTDWFARQGVSPPPIVGMTGINHPSGWPTHLPLLLKPLDPKEVLMALDRVRTPSSEAVPTSGK